MPRKTNAKQEPEQAKICKQAQGPHPSSGLGSLEYVGEGARSSGVNLHSRQWALHACVQLQD